VRLAHTGISTLPPADGKRTLSTAIENQTFGGGVTKIQ